MIAQDRLNRWFFLKDWHHGPHCMTGIGSSHLCTCGPSRALNEAASNWNYGKGPHPNDMSDAELEGKAA